MKKENSDKFEIDDLLKQTLKDDLPPELESSMQEQLMQFREKMEETVQKHREEAGRNLVRLFRREGLEWMKWIFKKQVLAPASIIMVVLGAVLQMSGPRSVLAESISLLKTSVIVSDQVSQASSMECLMKASAESFQHREYSIQWASPDKTQVQVKNQTQDIIKTIWISEEEITIEYHIANTLDKVESINQIDDPLLEQALSLLSPSDLVERMEGKWQLKQYKQNGDCEWGIFVIAIPEEKTSLELTVDLCTYFPIQIKIFLEDPKEESAEGEILMEVNFKWNITISPQSMLPQIFKGSSSG